MDNMLDVIWDGFGWQRPVRRKGFVLAGEGEELHLARIPDAEFEAYQPPVGLFRDLADVGTSPAAILKFANRYGVLGDGPAGIYISAWRDCAKQLAHLIAVADALKSSNWSATRTALASKDKLPKNLAAAAVERIGKVLKKEIIDHGLDMVGEVALMDKRAVIRFGHADLRGFLFFQLARDLLGNRDWRRCEGCGRWFELRPGTNRADKSTCSDSCRGTVYRRRKSAAKRLRAKGWAVPEIAAEIKADPKKVRQWVNNQE